MLRLSVIVFVECLQIICSAALVECMKLFDALLRVVSLHPTLERLARLKATGTSQSTVKTLEARAVEIHATIRQIST